MLLDRKVLHRLIVIPMCVLTETIIPRSHASLAIQRGSVWVSLGVFNKHGFADKKVAEVGRDIQVRIRLLLGREFNVTTY